MVKRILLSTAMLLGLATTSWAQCSTCGTNGGGYVDDIAYSQAYSQPAAAGGFGSRIRGIGQGIFSPVDSGCMNYKYTRLFGGVGYVDDVTEDGLTVDFDDGWGAGASLGRRIGRRRLELETSYRHNSFDFLDGDVIFLNGNLSTTAGMANLTFDWFKIGRSTFYTGSGIGLIYGDLHVTTGEGAAVDDEAFAYQGIFGLDRDLRNGMKGFVEYRYLGAEFDFNDDDFDYDAQNVFFGFEFRR